MADAVPVENQSNHENQYITSTKVTTPEKHIIDIENLLILKPDQQEQVDKLLGNAFYGNLQEIKGAHNKIKPLNEIDIMIIEDMPGFIFEGQNIFVRTDLMPGENAKCVALHEAVEGTFQKLQSRAIEIIQELGLADIWKAGNFNRDKPEHFVGLLYELNYAKEHGILEDHLRLLASIEERQVADLVKHGDKYKNQIDEIRGQQVARRVIASLLTD